MPKYTIHDQDSMNVAIQTIGNLNLDKTFIMDLEPKKDSRSLDQNRLMWKWHGIVGNEIGHIPPETHIIVMKEILAPKHFEYKGEMYAEYSTSKLNIKEMSVFLRDYYIWANAEHGINLPCPEDMHYENR